MLYKKYTIEIIQSVPNLVNCELNNGYSSYNGQIVLQIQNNFNSINVVKFLDSTGNISEYPIKYNTYKEAYDILNMYYYNINQISIIIKITEVFDDIVPPISIQRSLKIKKIAKCLKEKKTVY